MTDFQKNFDRAKEFILRYGNFFCIFALVLFCYLFLFVNLGNYKLLDVDETRYVNIARAMFANGDFITPNLNFDVFFEKPPLFYWLAVLSYKLTGSLNEFASRLPVALMSTVMVFSTYFFCKKALRSKIYGLVCALILLTNVWVLLFSHLAMLDLGFTCLMTLSVYCAAVTLFDVKEGNKKYFWWLSFLFMALSVLQKGFMGILVPASVVVLSFIALNKWKEILKPWNIIPGIIIFLLVALPWHILAYAVNGHSWFHTYIVKHHFARLMGLLAKHENEKPLLFYIPVIIAGFVPWIFSFISALIRGFKSVIKDFKATKSFRQIFSGDTNDRKMLVFCAIWALVTLVLFSVSKVKLPTYILPIFPSLALITGYYWWGYILDEKFEKGIKISSITGAVIMIILSITACLSVFFLPLDMRMFAAEAGSFRGVLISWVIILSLISILCLIARNRALLFTANVVLMLGITIIASAKIFTYTTTFGQTELENYAGKAQMVTGSRLVSFGFPVKYSLLNNFNGKVDYIQGEDNEAYRTLQDISKQAKKDKTPVYLIIRKNSNKPDVIFEGFNKVETGRKYDLYVK